MKDFILGLFNNDDRLKSSDIGEGVGHFPKNYLLGLIHCLSTNEKINLISYKDLAWPDHFENTAEKEHGQEEWKNWQKNLKNGTVSKDKIHLLIQYDIDSHVYAAQQVIKAHTKLKSKSNVMIFNRRVNRELFMQSQEVEYTDYSIGDRLLKKLIYKGACVGYHCNVAEASGFDYEKAENMFKQDVLSLRSRGLNIDYFSPHGGPRDINGNSNNSLPFLDEVTKDLKLKWVHNKISPSFTKQYSDGGINNKHREIDNLSMAKFLKSMKPGSRYRILIHPQYYFLGGSDTQINLCNNLEGIEWYENAIIHQNKSIMWWIKHWQSCFISE